ncbi:hypothetical protein BGX26_002370 [Mortierella sp. AD094]|nr:hypothetical protein BGX26_002370 [Mortierella sp. AD094]
MLLLVPSHKADDGGTGKNSTSHNRVLVFLPSDIDLSSNIVVPDTAITTTLGTNDTLDTNNGFSISPYSIQKSAFMDLTMYSRDHLGILQPSGPTEQVHPHQQNSQQSNIHRSPGRPDDTNLTPYYRHSDSQINRTRRHSHTGLVNGGTCAMAYSRSRTKSRQSISQSSPYQCQPVRTPRALRAAFRKARKDQSPLLTSTSFGSDYTVPNLTSYVENDDMDLSFRVAMSRPTAGSSNSSSTRAGSSGVEFGSSQSASSYRGTPISSHSVLSKGNATGVAAAHYDGYRYQAKSEIGEPNSDIELDENEVPNPWRGPVPITTTTNANSSLTKGFKRHVRQLSEVLDVDGLSDDEMCVEPKSFSNSISKAGGKSLETEEDRQDIDLDNTLDADMAMILGMTSDMELVMPNFDDEYLEDLKNDPILVGQSRRSSTISIVSPSCSHYSSTTITCLSSQPSPRSHSGTPSATTDETSCRAESLPVSPGVLAARARMQSPNASHVNSRSSQSPNSSVHSPAQDLSIIHRDIDHLKRHRDSLKQSSDMTTNSLPKSSCSSSPTTTNERKSQGPIYFKPSHHSLPVQSSPSEYPRQNIMIIQSNQWTFDNKGSSRARVFPPESIQGNRDMQGNGGNQIFRIQEPSHSPPQPQPPQVQSSLNKSTMMTANNISLVTANMSVLTPQEVQEDYYTRRNLRIYQQRQRRKSAVLDRGSSVGPPFGSTEGFSPWARRFSTSDVHPLERPVMPAIGANPLPASYYIPPSAFRTEAAVAAEKEAERKRREQEEESFLVFPSPTLS